ncbi:MAG: SUMF1/EgtB/PvdO family nonheme iron enzyme [Desulfovibrionaceae bacterium]
MDGTDGSLVMPYTLVKGERMRFRHVAAWCLMAALVLVCTAPSLALAAQRVALVIGNGAYEVGPLRNPVNDASDIAAKLRGLGFDVMLVRDADQRTMDSQIGAFRQKLSGAAIRLFYYAGHGMQIKGVNYLLPVDIDAQYEEDVKYKAVDAGRVLDHMAAAGKGANIVILDACRNNPFARSFRSSARGLARMPELDGSIVVYATSPGNVAADGRGRNGLFTEHFLKYVDKPGLTLEQVFKRTGRDVAQATGDDQRPWLSLGIYDDIYLAGGSPSGASASAPRPQEVAMDQRPQQAPTPSEPRKGDIWTDPTTGMEFVRVPGGCFQMGSPASEKDRDADEGPVHEVCVDGFWMGKTEVSRGQFRRFVEQTGYATEAEKKGSSFVFNKASGWEWQSMPGFNWKNAGFSQDDTHPVVHTSWNDATAMATWLSSASVGSFRLPTEAEWEYAARAGTSGMRYWGNDDAVACRYANAADRTAFPEEPGKVWSPRFECDEGYWGTAPVANYQPNAFGLYDMMGNVWEWCQDWYDKDYYSSSPRSNPRGPGGGAIRVDRGGSWSSEPGDVRSAYRYRNTPSDTFNDLGFRLLRTN